MEMAVWLSGNALVVINEVTLRRARLVLGWVTARGYTVFVFNHATQLNNSALHPSRVGKSSRPTCLPGWGKGRARSLVSGVT